VTDTFLTRAAGTGLRALADPRLAGAAAEYASAREELRTDTPITRKQAVTEASVAVEGVMQVLLDERDVERDGTEAAKRLFDLLTANGIADTAMADIVLAPSPSATTASSTAAEPRTDDVTAAEAEAVVAAAPNAMTFSPPCSGAPMSCDDPRSGARARARGAAGPGRPCRRP
jgi:hypothetical protein